MTRRRATRYQAIRPIAPKTVLIAFVLVGIYQYIGLNVANLWADEAFSWFAATQTGFFQISASPLILTDVHPPLYLVLLNGWMGLTGSSEIALRGLSMLFILLTLAGSYQLARWMFNDRVAYFTLILLGLAPFTALYGQEARQYALSMAAFVWALYGLLLLLQGNEKQARRGAFLYVIGGVVALYSLYFCALALAAVNVWAVLSRAAFRPWRGWLAANLIIGVAFAPQLAVFLSQAGTVLGGYWPPTPNLLSLIETLVYLIYGYSLWDTPVRVVVYLFIIFSVILSLYEVLRRAPIPARGMLGLCVVGLLGPMVAALLISVSGRASVYVYRSFAMLSPLWLIVLAAGMAYARRPSPTPIFALALMLIMVLGRFYVTQNPDVYKSAYRPATRLMAQVGPEYPILHLYNSAILPMHYYAPHNYPRTVVVETGDRAWITTPEVWNIFRVPRPGYAAALDWAQAQSGPFFVVAPKDTAPREQILLAQMLIRCPNAQAAKFGPDLTVYLVRCPAAASVQG